jgi:biotin carboxyl carrier protein
MTGGSKAGAAIDDARALLDALVTSDWQDMHVVAGETEIFIAKTTGRANPMREAPSSIVPEVIASTETHDVRAPHVATFVGAVAIGSRVAVGDRVATLRVLDQEQELLADVAGTIAAHPVAAGALIEFGASVVTLGKAA